ncbi:MAG: hypothetical protein COA63_003545 [Methylophaga sp.]|nr:hypothetical protein [Methylophaga sp.]
MTLSKLKKSEQILFASIIIILVLGAYSFFRFIPENDDIAKLHRQVEKTQIKLLDTDIPNEPEQNVAELLTQLDDQEHALALTQSMADEISQRLAPFDSQDLKVRISELAQKSKMRIVTNEEFSSLNHLHSPSKFNTQQYKDLSKTERKARRKAARAAQQQTKKQDNTRQTDLILAANYSWIERMSAKTMFYRPLQRLVVEGSYQSLRSFIQGLDHLEWQVTIVRLDIEAMPFAPPRGYPQLLQAELVLAL